MCYTCTATTNIIMTSAILKNSKTKLGAPTPPPPMLYNCASILCNWWGARRYLAPSVVTPLWSLLAFRVVRLVFTIAIIFYFYCLQLSTRISLFYSYSTAAIIVRCRLSDGISVSETLYYYFYIWVYGKSSKNRHELTQVLRWHDSPVCHPDAASRNVENPILRR